MASRETYRYEFGGGRSRKFWQVNRTGKTVLFTWGRIGTAGQELKRDLGSEDLAAELVWFKCKEKEARGYKLVFKNTMKVEAEYSSQQWSQDNAGAAVCAHPRVRVVCVKAMAAAEPFTFNEACVDCGDSRQMTWDEFRVRHRLQGLTYAGAVRRLKYDWGVTSFDMVVLAAGPATEARAGDVKVVAKKRREIDVGD